MARSVKKQANNDKGEISVDRGRLLTLRRLGVIKPLKFMFLVIWILIGIFVLAFIVQGTKRGMFDYVLFGKVPQNSQAPSAEAPTETELPKIGKINIACAESALKPESIQKLVGEYAYDISKLEATEKTAFEKCIVAPPQPSPKP